ncbi:MAG: OmpA family protein [Prevotellaceae bacterium]|jgi:outer membrane protein OmpA-like peptidoglycan-associated protein|nr:OmpA family protein [Prevotellaceae bacterium]
MKIKTKTRAIILTVLILFTASCASQKKLTSEEIKKVYMQDIYTALTNEISNDAEVEIVEDSVKVIFTNGILFKVNQNVIVDELYPCFSRFAKVLNKYVNTTILITGHTDNTGDERINIDLSQKRADSAKKLLAELEVLESRIFTLGHGSAISIDSNSTLTGRARNRRVEFIILYNYHENKK